MRILQVIPAFAASFGGTSSVVRMISKELAKKHEVVVYTTTALDPKHDFDPLEEEVNGYKVIYFKRTLKPLCYSGIFGQLNLSYDMMQAVKQNLREFDVVHVHSWMQFPDVLIHHYATKYGVPYVLQVHGSLPRIMAKQRLKWIYYVFFGYRLLRDASRVVALTQKEAQQCRKMGVSVEKIELIPNGIDLSEYGNPPSRDFFKKRFNINENKKIILFLGRIHKIKGIDILVKAYAYAVKELGLDDVLLVIAGPDDGYLNELKKLLSSLKMTNDVLFLGPLYGRCKFEAYVNADLFVLPSLYETFPNVILEAYACSRPVIASNVESISDIVLHGKTGLLFRACDIKDLAEKIKYMLLHPEESKQMGNEARKLVEEKFSIDKVVSSHEALYEKLLRKKENGVTACRNIESK